MSTSKSAVLQPPVNLTVADALGSLGATVKAAEAEFAKGHLDEDTRRNQKALICIEARSAFTCYKDFLRWRAMERLPTDADLLRTGKDLHEAAMIQSEFAKAAQVIRKLGAEESDRYLSSVQEKLTALNR